MVFAGGAGVRVRVGVVGWHRVMFERETKRETEGDAADVGGEGSIRL